MEVKQMNAQGFARLLEGKKPVLVDFYADWCGPCRMLAPVVAEIAEAHPEIEVIKINVDEEGALAAQFGVSSIPFLAFLKNGKLVASSLGYRSRGEIEAALNL